MVLVSGCPARPPGTCSGHMSTVHVGAFFFIASVIILVPDSPIWFPWRLEEKGQGWAGRLQVLSRKRRPPHGSFVLPGALSRARLRLPPS